LYNKKINTTGDITPSYSGLSVSRLKSIKENFEKHSVEIRPVILIRDPVTRAQSSVRMNLDRGNYNNVGIPVGEKDYRIALEHYYKSEHCKIRTSYKEIIENAEEVFGPSNIHVQIFETMFSKPNLRALSNFCNVNFDPNFSKVKVYKTRGQVTTDARVEAEIRAFYGDVYEYCYNNFPETQDVWTQENNPPQIAEFKNRNELTGHPS
ncbi:MAG: hypothetical protein ACI8Z9_002451, partial [Paraglaciecola sp.]